MLQAFRIAILSLLALMQLFAPLVHAHAGGGPFSGMIHIPGLEFLSKQDGSAVQSLTCPGDADGLIVGLELGLKNQGDQAIPAPDLDSALLVYFSLRALAPPSLPVHFPSSAVFPVHRGWLSPVPRAPPA
jgi:hypothetical protein